MSTRLDANQVIKKVYDDDTESLRTLATVVVADITFDVNLDAEDDSVTVAQNGTDVGPSNPLYTQTTNGALESTQQEVVENLAAIEEAILSIDIDFDAALSTRASEATQLDVLSELQNLDRGIGPVTAQTLRTASNTLATDPNGATTENRESGVVLSNSTTTPLLAGATFTGAWVDCSQYSCVSWTINSDVDSATNGLRLQFSHDGTTLIRQSAATFTGSANGVFFSFPVHAKYFRMYYENGAVNQTRFYLDVQLHEEYNGLAAVPLDVALNDKSSATAVKAVIAGKSVDGSYQNQRASGVSTLNSTSAPLGAGATFTGTFEDVVGFANIAITTYSNVDSTTDGLIAEFSTDGVNVDHSDYYTVPAGQGNQFTFGVTARYFRIRYINGSVAQATFRLGTLYNLSDIKSSSIRIDDDITGQNDAELVKAVSTGKNPDGVFTNVRVQGIDSSNSTTVPLDANETYRGTWVRWSDDYTSVVSIFKADVAGTLYLEASQEEFPVDGSDVSVSFLLELPYDPNVNPVIRRNSPLQSRWARHRYVNGPAAQSSMNLTAILCTTDPGDTYAEASSIPTHATFVGAHRSINTIVNADASGYQDVPVDAITGNPKNTISNIRDDILLKPLSTAFAAQVVVGIEPVRIDPFPVANRRSTMISNDGTSDCALGFSDSITFDSGSIRIPAGSVRILPFSESVEYWSVTQDTGGVESTLTRTGTTTGGTATNTGNTLISDNIYANISANGQTSTVTGFTSGTANPLVSVKIGMEGAKQSAQFETVAVSEVQSGATTGAGTVSSASLAGGIQQLYVAFISRNNNTGTITQVLGGGKTFSPSLQNVTVGNRRIDAWYAYGTFSAGAVTASLAASTNAHITVYRIINADGTTPIQTVASNSGTGTAVTGPTIAGTNKGYSLVAVSHASASGTAGVGYTENADATNGSGGNIDSLSAESKAITVTGAETGTYTLNASSSWAAIGMTITPAAANDPIVTMSYELSAVAGATAALAHLESTSDAIYLLDITGDRAWTVADIPNIKVIATGTLISSAAANIDQLYLELVDTTGNTTRLSIVQGGEAVI